MANDSELVSFSGSEIAINGRLFSGSASELLKDAIGREIGKLTDEGRTMVVEKLNARPAPSAREQARTGKPGRGRTGFTAANVEAVHTPANSLYGKVRMKPGVMRPGARTERATYIVAAVIETGRRGGSRTRRLNVNLKSWKARSRSRWQAGNRTQRPVFMFRNAARVLKARVPDRLEAALKRGLE